VARRRRLVSSPGIDDDFSALRYVTHLASSALLPTRELTPRPPLVVKQGEIGITFVGHATVLVELDGVRILTDPVLSHRLFLLKRLVAPGIPAGGLPPLDLVLVSHGHHDHLDVPSHRRLARQETTVVVAKNLGDLVARLGYGRVVELAWGDEFRHGSVRVRALEVNHWGRRNLLPDGRGYTGFLIEGESGSVFFPGDTAYTPLFREYGERYSIDVALLPIGAYEPPSFRRVHMNPEDALRAFVELRARHLVPIHWGTFVLSYEAIDEPPRWIAELAREAGLENRLALLAHGEGAVFSRPPSAERRG
jgi:L-ascorbate metabolism protein UlaG (beta-lactamase superfamily)